MLLYYALGGGYGHLTRGLAVLRALNLPSEEVLFVASNKTLAQHLTNINVLWLPENFPFSASMLRLWLDEIIFRYNVTEVFLDAFPCGIACEWAHWHNDNIALHLIARLLNRNAFVALKPEQLPTFQTVYETEPLFDELTRLYCLKALRYEALTLKYSHPSPTSETLQKLLVEDTANWLIAHSGKTQETKLLIEMAVRLINLKKLKPNIIIATPEPITDIVTHNIYPIVSLYPFVDKIITAAGFNSIHEASSFRHKHLVLAFSRRYDDQFLRAARL